MWLFIAVRNLFCQKSGHFMHLCLKVFLPAFFSLKSSLPLSRVKKVDNFGPE